MTEEPLFGHILPPASKSTTYIKAALRDMDAPLGFANIKDWNSFANYNINTATRKAAASNPEEGAKITDLHELTRFGPYSRYEPAAASDLGQFFGRKNYAVTHKPEWISLNAAVSLIEDPATKAKTPEEKAIWQSWGVKSADLDDDPTTADNVIVFDDVRAGNVKAIDGYHFIPRSKIYQQKIFYDKFPHRAERKKINAGDKKFLRQYKRGLQILL
jgi:hypothetical protein